MAISLTVSSTVQTETQFTATATDVSGLKPANRTFSLTGVLGTAIQKGDAVEIWGSNDGGTTYQPIRAGNNAPVQLNYYNPEVVINDCCDHYGTRRVSVGAGSTLTAVGLNGEAAQNPLVQSGTVTLSGGAATISGKIVTAASILVPTVVTQGGTMTGFASINVVNNYPTQTFSIEARKDDNTLPNSSSVVNYVIVG